MWVIRDKVTFPPPLDFSFAVEGGADAKYGISIFLAPRALDNLEYGSTSSFLHLSHGQTPLGNSSAAPNGPSAADAFSWLR